MGNRGRSQAAAQGGKWQLKEASGNWKAAETIASRPSLVVSIPFCKLKVFAFALVPHCEYELAANNMFVSGRVIGSVSSNGQSSEAGLGSGSSPPSPHSNIKLDVVQLCETQMIRLSH